MHEVADLLEGSIGELPAVHDEGPGSKNDKRMNSVPKSLHQDQPEETQSNKTTFKNQWHILKKHCQAGGGWSLPGAGLRCALALRYLTV